MSWSRHLVPYSSARTYASTVTLSTARDALTRSGRRCDGLLLSPDSTDKACRIEFADGTSAVVPVKGGTAALILDIGDIARVGGTGHTLAAERITFLWRG